MSWFEGRLSRLAASGIGVAGLVVSALGGAAWAAGAYGPPPMDLPGGMNSAMPGALWDFGATKEGAPAGQGVITYTATVRLKPGSKQARVSDITMTLMPVDASGNAIGPARALAGGSVNIPTGSARKVPLSCRAAGPERKDVIRFRPTRVEMDTEIGTLNLASMFLRSSRTPYVDAPNASEVMSCFAGGAIVNEGYRLLQAGAGVAYRDAERSNVLGWAWSSGQPNAVTTKRAAFPQGFETKSGVVGTVRQGAGGRLTGSIMAPAENSTEPYARNAAHAWWEIAEDCLDDSRCSGIGDRGFHGSTGNAVWIIHQGEPNVFVVTGYARYACADPNAPACS